MDLTGHCIPTIQTVGMPDMFFEVGVDRKLLVKFCAEWSRHVDVTLTFCGSSLPEPRIGTVNPV